MSSEFGVSEARTRNLLENIDFYSLLRATLPLLEELLTWLAGQSGPDGLAKEEQPES